MLTWHNNHSNRVEINLRASINETGIAIQCKITKTCPLVEGDSNHNIIIEIFEIFPLPTLCHFPCLILHSRCEMYQPLMHSHLDSSSVKYNTFQSLLSPACVISAFQNGDDPLPDYLY